MDALQRRPQALQPHGPAPRQIDEAMQADGVLAEAVQRVSVNIAGEPATEALLANTDEGLVVARRDDPVNRIYCGGLVLCKAVMFQSEAAIAVAHTSTHSDELVALTREWADAFARIAGTPDFRVTVGFSKEEFARHIPGEDFEDMVCIYAVPPEEQHVLELVVEDARNACLAGVLLERETHMLADWTGAMGYALISPPAGALLLGFDLPPRVLDAAHTADIQPGD